MNEQEQQAEVRSNDGLGGVHVVLTEADIDDVRRWQPHIPQDYWPGLALAKKGIRFRPTFNPFREDDMLPPWEVWREPTTGDLHVWQGSQPPNARDNRP